MNVPERGRPKQRPESAEYRAAAPLRIHWSKDIDVGQDFRRQRLRRRWIENSAGAFLMRQLQCGRNGIDRRF